MKNIIAVLFLLLMGCNSGDMGNYPDKLYANDKNNDTFAVIYSDGEYYGTENWVQVMELEPKQELSDGEFAIVKADVTYLSGGIAGHMNDPQINKLKSFEKVSFDTVEELYGIENIKETSPNINHKLVSIDNGEYVFFNKGKYRLYSDKGLVETYDTEEELMQAVTD